MSSQLAAIVRAARPPFLVLAPVCVMLGVGVVQAQGHPLETLPLLLALLGGLSAHVSVNAFNEYFDFHSGLDLITERTPFSGGSGSLPENPAAARGVLGLAIGSLLLSFAIGGYFLWLGRAAIVPLGLLGLALVFFYTRWINRQPWLCLFAPGLGFGFLMVLGTQVALSGHVTELGLLVAAVPFLLANNLLLLNQYPDIEADRQVGRRHFAIAYGVHKANIVYALSVALAAALLMWGVFDNQLPTWTLLGLLPLPLAGIAWHGARRHGQQIGQHPKYLAANVMVALFTPALMAVGLFGA